MNRPRPYNPRSPIERLIVADWLRIETRQAEADMHQLVAIVAEHRLNAGGAR